MQCNITCVWAWLFINQKATRYLNTNKIYGDLVENHFLLLFAPLEIEILREKKSFLSTYLPTKGIQRLQFHVSGTNTLGWELILQRVG